MDQQAPEAPRTPATYPVAELPETLVTGDVIVLGDDLPNLTFMPNFLIVGAGLSSEPGGSHDVLGLLKKLGLVAQEATMDNADFAPFRDLLREAYGYEPGPGYWPGFKEGDSAAARHAAIAVAARYQSIKEGTAAIAVPPPPPAPLFGEGQRVRVVSAPNKPYQQGLLFFKTGTVLELKSEEGPAGHSYLVKLDHFEGLEVDTLGFDEAELIPAEADPRLAILQAVPPGFRGLFLAIVENAPYMRGMLFSASSRDGMVFTNKGSAMGGFAYHDNFVQIADLVGLAELASASAKGTIQQQRKQ